MLPEKAKGGRPTSYRPEYCEKVIEWGAMGKSRTWMAAHLGIDRSTIDNWAEANPEFFLALSRAKALEQAVWEDLGQDGLTADKFNSGVWAKSMAARFPSEWRDNVQVSGDPSAPMQTITTVEFVVVEPS